MEPNKGYLTFSPSTSSTRSILREPPELIPDLSEQNQEPSKQSKEPLESDLVPEYNIVKDAAVPSISSHTHLKASEKIMSEVKQGKPRPEGAGKPSKQIEVTDITNNTISYFDSMHEAARVLNMPSHNIITHYIQRNQKTPYKGQYTFKKL